MEIRTGLIQDIELLIDIDNDASTLFERAGLRLDSARDLEVTLAAAALAEMPVRRHCVHRDRSVRYERHGFVVIPAEQCGEQLRAELLFERRLLPDPQHRVVMRKLLCAGVMPLTASSCQQE